MKSRTEGHIQCSLDMLRTADEAEKAVQDRATDVYFYKPNAMGAQCCEAQGKSWDVRS